MEIYKYAINTKDWKNIVNSNLKGKQRQTAFDNYIKATGTKVTLQNYFDDDQRDSYPKDYSYQYFGEVKNSLERLAAAEMEYDDDLSYCSAKDNHPEDLCESRTDWDDMKNYADGLYRFIEQLKSEIASGVLTINKID